MWGKALVTALLVSSAAAISAAQGIAMISDQLVQPAWCDSNGGIGCYDGGCCMGSCDLGPTCGCEAPRRFEAGCGVEPCYDGCGDCCGACDLDCAPGCDYGEFFFNFDATFLKYHQSGGVKSVSAGSIVSSDYGAEFDYDFAPRFSFGYRGPNNLGVRTTYWMIDASQTTFDGDGFVSIYAQTFDLEVFKRIPMGCSSYLEAAAGFRAAEFKQRDDSDLDYQVDGTGLTFALEASHNCGCGRRLYARGRTSVVMGDTELLDEGALDDDVGIGFDSTFAQLEVAVGWEGRKCVGCGTMVYGVGIELQQWLDTVITADSSSEAYLTDAGFGGFTLRCGYEF